MSSIDFPNQVRRLTLGQRLRIKRFRHWRLIYAQQKIPISRIRRTMMFLLTTHVGLDAAQLKPHT